MALIKQALKNLLRIGTGQSNGLIVYDEVGDVVYSDDPTVPVVVKPTSIWKSVEADAWSRNFGYGDYLIMCTCHKIEPVTEYTYGRLYQTLQSIMDNDPQMQPSDDSEAIVNPYSEGFE